MGRCSRARTHVTRAGVRCELAMRFRPSPPRIRVRSRRPHPPPAPAEDTRTSPHAAPTLRARQLLPTKPPHTRQRWPRTPRRPPLPPPPTRHPPPAARGRRRPEPKGKGGGGGGNAPREDGLGGDVEHGGVVAAAGGLLRAVAQPRRRGEQDGGVVHPLLPRGLAAALAGAPLQGVLLLALLRQGRLLPRRRRRRAPRRGDARRPAQPVDEGGGHRGGGPPHGGRRRRRRWRRRRAPQALALRARLRCRLLRALLLLRPHPLGRQPQPEARRLRHQHHVPQLRDPGGDGRVAGADGDVDAQRDGEAHVPQHGELLRRACHRAARHALLLPAPHGIRQREVLLPGEEEPAQPGRGGGGRQGAALRRRVGAEQHAGEGRAAAAGAAAADGEAPVPRLRAGEAGEAQVPHRRAVRRPPRPGQARQARLPQEIMHPRLAGRRSPSARVARPPFFLLSSLDTYGIADEDRFRIVYFSFSCTEESKESFVVDNIRELRWDQMMMNKSRGDWRGESFVVW